MWKQISNLDNLSHICRGLQNEQMAWKHCCRFMGKRISNFDTLSHISFYHNVFNSFSPSNLHTLLLGKASSACNQTISLCQNPLPWPKTLDLHECWSSLVQLPSQATQDPFCCLFSRLSCTTSHLEQSWTKFVLIWTSMPLFFHQPIQFESIGKVKKIVRSRFKKFVVLSALSHKEPCWKHCREICFKNERFLQCLLQAH